jgi:hypothetical protein
MLKLLKQLPDKSLGSDWDLATEVFFGLTQHLDQVTVHVKSPVLFRLYLFSIVKLTLDQRTLRTYGASGYKSIRIVCYITPKIRNMIYKSEADLQAKCYQWFAKTFPAHRSRYFLIYNNPPNQIVAAMLKTMGLNRGIADALYITTNNDYHWFEFKMPGKIQSEEQRDFDKLVGSANYSIIRSVENFQEIILNLNK